MMVICTSLTDEQDVQIWYRFPYTNMKGSSYRGIQDCHNEPNGIGA